MTGVTAEHSDGTYYGYVDIKRISLGSAALAATAALLLPAASPAQATSSLFPVDCQTNNVVLDEDGATYELYGTCGVVTVTGDDITVQNMPATRTLIVRGQRDHISGKPIDRIVLRGRDSQVTAQSSRVARVASPGSTLTVLGLLEHARIPGNGARVHAERLTEVVVDGNRNVVRADQRSTVVRDRGHHNRIRVHRRA